MSECGVNPSNYGFVMAARAFGAKAVKILLCRGGVISFPFGSVWDHRRQSTKLGSHMADRELAQYRSQLETICRQQQLETSREKEPP